MQTAPKDYNVVAQFSEINKLLHLDFSQSTGIVSLY